MFSHFLRLFQATCILGRPLNVHPKSSICHQLSPAGFAGVFSLLYCVTNPDKPPAIEQKRPAGAGWSISPDDLKFESQPGKILFLSGHM
jgi:hypothetical protein